MDCKNKCYLCEDFKISVGHETKWCPKNICKKCGQNGHTKMDCMVNFENCPLPNEILFMIFGYLNQKDKSQWSMVCKRFCKFYTKADTAASNGSSSATVTQRLINSLIHACQCRNAACPLSTCRRMKRVISHTRQCKLKSDGGCNLCKQLIALCCYHAKTCQESKCLVHFCKNIKRKIAQQERMLEAVMHRRMDYKIKCYKCVDFKKNVGHETKWCRKNICKKCGQSGHTKMDCMVDFENFPTPNEILYMIFRHLNQEDKNQWAMVCKRFWQVKKNILIKPE